MTDQKAGQPIFVLQVEHQYNVRCKFFLDTIWLSTNSFRIFLAFQNKICDPPQLQMCLGARVPQRSIEVFPKWSRTVIEFRELRESENSLKHELGSLHYKDLLCYPCLSGPSSLWKQISYCNVKSLSIKYVKTRLLINYCHLSEWDFAVSS